MKYSELKGRFLKQDVNAVMKYTKFNAIASKELFCIDEVTASKKIRGVYPAFRLPSGLWLAVLVKFQ